MYGRNLNWNSIHSRWLVSILVTENVGIYLIRFGQTHSTVRVSRCRLRGVQNPQTLFSLCPSSDANLKLLYPVDLNVGRHVLCCCFVLFAFSLRHICLLRANCHRFDTALILGLYTAYGYPTPHLTRTRLQRHMTTKNQFILIYRRKHSYTLSQCSFGSTPMRMEWL